MTCPRCRKKPPPGAAFCPKCGAALTASARRQRPAGIGSILNAIAKTAARLCDAQYAGIQLVEGNQLRVVGKYGSLPGSRRLGQMHPVTRDTATGAAIIDRRTVHIRDLKAGIKGQYKATAARQAATGIRTFLATPLLHEGTPLGTIVVARTTVRPFTSKQIALLEAFAEHAATAIDKTRLAQVLAEALEQQTATSEILRVIASSPTDIQPTFEAIARAATRLSEADFTGLYRFDGDLIHYVAQHGRTPEEIEAVQRAFPQKPGRHSVTARAILTAAVVQIADVGEEPEMEDALRIFRTALSVPLIHDGRPLGAITVARRMVKPFTDTQIALLQTFADQAVIAIENVRLFRDLTEALEQQTATSEILRVISSSPTTLDPVLETVVKTAALLCDANNASLYRVEGDLMRKVAGHGSVPTSIEIGDTRLVTSRTVTGRAMLERRILHIHDLLAEVDTQDPVSRDYIRREGIRTFVATPLLREGGPIGAIAVYRTEVRPFSDKQLGLLQTFADQAVIAIENVRLFKELEARNRDLSVALDRQTATSEILRVIGGSPTDAQPVFDAIARSAVQLLGGFSAGVLRLVGDDVHLVAITSTSDVGDEAMRARYPRPLADAPLSAQAVRERAPCIVSDTEADPLADEEMRQVARARGFRSQLQVPMLREDTTIGLIGVTRGEPGPFAAEEIALLQTFADQAVIAIENVRLFTELEARNRDLTATSEILQVISTSTTDAQPVFQTIAEAAVRLSGALFGSVYRFDGDLIHMVAQHNYSPAALEFSHRTFPTPPTRHVFTGRAILERAVVHVPDVSQDPERDLARDLAEVIQFRSVLSVPMLREGNPIGAITVWRSDVGPFSEKHVALLQTFADQAVIAIENVRLFKELEARNRDLSVALDRQTATSEVLRVIGSSPTDAEPVFDAIVRSAVRLLGAFSGVVLRLVGDDVHLAAITSTSELGDDVVRVRYPRPLADTPLAAQVVRERAPCVVSDMEVDPRVDAELREAARARGYRSTLLVPMLREDTPIGVINVSRREPGPFAAEEIALLQTFADQAVIAIENVRLFKELEARNRDLTEALEQQTATAEILRAISSSPTEVQPVFDTVVRNSARLCAAHFAVLIRLVNGQIHLAAYSDVTPEYLDVARRSYPLPLDRNAISGVAMLERRAVHVHDVLNDDRFQVARDLARTMGYRSVLFVPMLREGVPIGAIGVAGAEPFSDSQIELLKTFADQAVIAIENVRLFKELEARNRDLTEALEQQTATAEILRAISSSPTDIRPVLETLVNAAARFCGATNVALLILNGGVLRGAAAAGPFGDELIRSYGSIEAFEVPMDRGSVTGRSVLERRTVHLHDLAAVPESEFPVGRELQRRLGHRTLVSTPLLREGTPIGAILLFKTEVKPFSDKQLELLQTFADQAVIAIENVRLFTELEARNRDLTEALEQQTATSEILRVISQSQTDVQPVFETIVRSAARLCDAVQGNLQRFDGERMHLVATHNWTPEALELASRQYPMRLDNSRAASRAILNRAVVNIPDVFEDSEYSSDAARVSGTQSVLSVPMLREGKSIGVITVARGGARPFSENHIELLKTFADQAVIAIENVRLFKELEARTQELTQSVEQLTALGEVSRAVSSTLDVETVLATIVSRASLLASADGCMIYEYDEDTEEFHVRATHNLEPAFEEAIRPVRIRKGEGVSGRSAELREPLQVADITQPGTYESSIRDLVIQAGYRSALAVPLLREDEVIGSLTLTRKTPGEFSPEIVETLKTFATQSALAIQNARLFREIEEKGRQLEVASRHKSQFLANMSHELRTPLNAILGYTELLQDGIYGQIPEKAHETMQRVDRSGRHLLALINDVLDLSKIEAGQLTLSLGDYSLKEVVETVVTALEPLAAEKKLSLRVSLAPDLPVGRGDDRRLSQVLLNLVGNAVKFTDAGEVRVEAKASDGAFLVSVSDTGPGIAPEDQQRIFEEFQQADTSSTRKKGGTGLGLSIARRILALHGGRIWVESAPGKGSTFSFTVPVQVERMAEEP